MFAMIPVHLDDEWKRDGSRSLYQGTLFTRGLCISSQLFFVHNKIQDTSPWTPSFSSIIFHTKPPSLPSGCRKRKMGGFSEYTGRGGKSGGTLPFRGRRKGERGGYRGNGKDGGCAKGAAATSTVSPQRERQVAGSASKQDQFILSNYRLLLHPDVVQTEYRIGAAVQWDDICEAVQLSEDDFLCPICFEYPSAARIAKCGHLFCLPCLVRCMEKQGKGLLDFNVALPCPLCNKDLSYATLKPVSSQVKTHSTASSIPFSLVSRKKGVMMCTVLNEAEKNKNARFNQISIASGEDAVSVCKRELEEINEKMSQVRSLCGGVKDVFTESGTMACLEVTAEVLQQRLADTIAEFPKDIPKEVGAKPLSRRAQMLQDQDTTPEAAIPAPQLSATATPFQPFAIPSSATHHTFYQASDGRVIILHPIHAAAVMATQAFNISLPCTPPEEVVQTEETTRQYPFAAHIPLQSSFYIAKLDLKAVALMPNFASISKIEDGISPRVADIVRSFELPEVKEPEIVETPVVTRRTSRRGKGKGGGGGGVVETKDHPSTQELWTLLEGLGVGKPEVVAALHPRTLNDVAEEAEGNLEAVVDYVLERLS